MQDDSEKSPEKDEGRWRRLWRHPSSKWLIGIPVGAWCMFVLGVFGMIGFEIVMYQTGTEKFCTTACHSMEAFTAPEWRDSIHYTNPSGVKASCADCHIPKVYPQYLWAKAYDGGRHVVGEILGSIETREKYEERRIPMSEYVWKNMKANDSRECRSCHTPELFEVARQDQRAARAHQQGFAEGKTCIDCHKGIAHKTPDEVAEELASLSEGSPSL
jgi:nitrate/TMAO reductase-like tetraheme cytochrome c subunit